MSDLAEVIAKHAPKLAADLVAAADEHSLEAELLVKADEWLRRFYAEAGLKYEPRAERRVVFSEAAPTGKKSARIDRLFNSVVVEFEPPGSLKPFNEAAANRHAVKQVQEQVDALVKAEGWQEDKVSGVVLDGKHFIFCRRARGVWIVEAPEPVDEHSAARFLRLLATLSREPLLPELVVKRFGIQQEDTSVGTVRALMEALRNPTSPRARALLKQWLEFYSDVAGLDVSKLSQKKEIAEFARRVTKRSTISPDELSMLLFALYTYGAMLMKFLAVAVVTPYFADKVAEPLSRLTRLDDSRSDEFLNRLRDIETGEWFRRLGILNLCEGDFFGWYVDEWQPAVARQVKLVIDTLAQYDPTVVEQTPERVRDLMKRIYHSLLPRDVRKSLGEYYTPDWLAERLLMQVDSTLFTDFSPKTGHEARYRVYAHEILPKLTATRWLDPTCGSGTFLVLILNRLKMHWRVARQLTKPESDEPVDTPSRKDFLAALLRNVWGFDLNPLAVIASRTNYLLSIVDLIEPGEQIEIPVYLADSVALPAKGAENLFSEGVYELPMRGIGAKLPVPAELATQEKLPELARLLARDVAAEVPVDTFMTACQTAFGLRPDVWKRAEPHLQKLYETLLGLHRQNSNGLWAAVAKNMFMPLFIEPVDYVIGNPPWVNWEGLPDGYRDTTQDLWRQYGLFVHSGMDVMLGKGKKDISMLVSYVASDRYLKRGGKLGFVITQSVFKSSGAGQGFRRFRLGEGDYLGVRAVDDFVALQPFEGATNRTATFVCQKGQKTKYPFEPYTIWIKRQRKGPDFWDDWLSAVPLLEGRSRSANHIVAADETSAWITGRKEALRAAVKVIGASAYRACAGAYSGGVNAVYWLEVLRRNADGTVTVRMVTEGAKKQVPPPHTHTIEADLLYPLLRGRDVKRWLAAPQPGYHFLITQDPTSRNGIPEHVLKDTMPRLYAYLLRYKNLLLERKSSSVVSLMERGAFFSMFAVSDQTFALDKVVWPEVATKLQAAVVSTPPGERPTVPDHKLIMVPCESVAEAHYLAAALNSAPAQFVISSYIVLDPDPHVLTNVRVPKFGPHNRVHLALSALSQEAHHAVKGEPARPLGQIEAEIDEVAAELWGLSPEEMEAIQRDLRELNR